MAGDGQGVIIEELRPPRRILRLEGEDRPEKGVQVADEQTDRQSWYPGAAQASTQVIGQKAEPILLRGWFFEQSAISGTTIAQRIQLARDLMRSGNLCRLTWGDRIHRVGRVKRVQIEHQTENEVRYEITFAVDSARETANAIKPPKASTAALRDAIRRARDVAQEAGDVARTVLLVAGVLPSARNVDAEEALAERADAALRSMDPDALTDASIEAVRAELEGVRGDGRAAMAAREGVQVEDLQVATDGAGLIRLWRWRANTRRATLQLLGRARDLADLATEIRVGTPRRVVVSREGETLQSIAQRELGDWREWTRILAANADLSAGALASGTPIVLPERRS